MDQNIRLTIVTKGRAKTIQFCLAERKDEIEEISRLRARVYSRKNYFLEPKDVDIDQFDENPKTAYFFARYNNKIIGALRMLRDETLPTERYFRFSEPADIEAIGRNDRCEISRLVVERQEDESFPRNLIMIFLILRATRFAESVDIFGGYSFVKEGLQKKLTKIKFPFHLILSYTQDYPEDGVLFRYFNDDADKVVPIYFLTSETTQYLEGLIKRKFLIKETEVNNFVLRNTPYTKLLKSLRII